MSHDDRDLEMERRLREELAATADTVQPGGDGLMRIQQRIGERRSRDRWLRPVLVLGSVVVVAAIAVGGVAIARNGNGPAKVGPGHSPSPSPSVHPVPHGEFPPQGFFPFSNAADEAAWEQEFAQGHSPWQSDPAAVSESWLQNYLLQKALDLQVAKVVHQDTADVTYGRRFPDGVVHPVTTVHLVRYHNAWLVTGASADGYSAIKIANPAPGAEVTSPVIVSGPGFGVDERATVEVRDAQTPTLLGQAKTGMFGSGTQQWSASPTFTPSKDGVGVIVASVVSPADGGLGQLTAEKVVFASSSATNTSGGFYGVQNGSIQKFSGGGAPEGAVAISPNPGPVVEVRHVGDTLYFTAGTASCASTLYSVPAVGGTASSAVKADQGYGIEGFDVTPGGSLTFYERACSSSAPPPQAKLRFEVVRQTAGLHSTGYISFDSEPPAIVGDPVWESDGVHIDAFVRTGMSGYLARYDTQHGDKAMPSSNACPGYDVNKGMPGALTTAPDGTLWFAVQTGTSMQVLSCSGGTPTVETTVTKTNDTPASLSVDSAGNILIADVTGHVWNINTAGGTEAALSTGSPITSVTW